MAQFNTRIQHKRGTEAEWKLLSFAPLDGELIVYQPDNNHKSVRFKIGDGITPINDLPFVTSPLPDFGGDEAGLILQVQTDGSLAWVSNNTTVYELPLASASTRGGIQVGYTANNANIPVEIDDGRAYVALTSDALTSAIGIDTGVDLGQSIIALSVDGKTVTYFRADGTSGSFQTQDENTEYFLATETETGLTKLYASIGFNEDGTMTQKAITEALNSKVGVNINGETLIFTI